MSLAPGDPALNASLRPSADQAGCETGGNSPVSRRTSKPSTRIRYSASTPSRSETKAISPPAGVLGGRADPGRGNACWRDPRCDASGSGRRCRAPERRTPEDPGQQRAPEQPLPVDRPHDPSLPADATARQAAARIRVRTVAVRPDQLGSPRYGNRDLDRGNPTGIGYGRIDGSIASQAVLGGSRRRSDELGSCICRSAWR